MEISYEHIYVWQVLHVDGNLQFGYVSKLVTMYGEDATSQRDTDMCIDNYFTGIISTRRVTVLCDHC
jgi:hypothetical protein